MLTLADIFRQAYHPHEVEALVAVEDETAEGDTKPKQSFMFLPSDVGGADALVSCDHAGLRPIPDVTKGMLVKYAVPAGWHIGGHGHHYSELLDANGHVRAILQLDRFRRRMVKARMPLIGRFYLYTAYNEKDDGFTVQVRDRDNGGAVVFTAEPYAFRRNAESYLEGVARCNAEATAWLDANYANWRDPSAHR